MAHSEPKFTLYTVGTPNGITPKLISLYANQSSLLKLEASAALEELGLPYKVYKIDFSKNEQKEEWFLKINPNGRIPALVDHSAPGGDFSVFESGAILQYLADNYDPDNKLLPADPLKRSVAIQWLYFQMGGIGPMQGQASHFHRFATEKIEYAIKRYHDETRRLYTVLERGLVGKPWLAGDDFTVADIANASWVLFHTFAGVSVDGLPNLQRWMAEVKERPSFKRGANVPDPSPIYKPPPTEEEAEKTAAEARAWVLNSNKKEAVDDKKNDKL
ncbi:hypothetical protein SmJEL517_g04955 [Synchytrium microbalum]|uniref:Glutathione transferase n=1 Tax=Synchytrium microbalum TaxID=1806994 RepID=A0A507BY42_9FUNG|nr:uncharacterized protein SmJEL517_g04955 [Synchytrium microbalum]TPX31779.1 hypothetical protein SmJEL517_g04955 [Synchytrium microbalum]